MTLSEFSDQFDVLYNNITSNQAPGLNEYEKSVYLTKAQNEIVKNYFTANSKGNNIGQGFDDSAKRQADFSCLMKTMNCDAIGLGPNSSASIQQFTCTVGSGSSAQSQILYGNQIQFFDRQTGAPVTKSTSCNVTYSGGVHTTDSGDTIVIGFPFQSSGSITISNATMQFNSGKIDQRSTAYAFPSDVFIAINETIRTTAGKYLQVVPLRYDEYLRLMSKPFKRPLKYQAWRLINSGSSPIKVVEIITNLGDAVSSYSIRYIRRPKPIIVANLDGLSIDGFPGPVDCELDPILHEDVLQRAVELAKVAWTATGQENVQLVMQAGQRSE